MTKLGRLFFFSGEKWERQRLTTACSTVALGYNASVILVVINKYDTKTWEEFDLFSLPTFENLMPSCRWAQDLCMIRSHGRRSDAVCWSLCMRTWQITEPPANRHMKKPKTGCWAILDPKHCLDDPQNCELNNISTLRLYWHWGRFILCIKY